MPTLTLRAAAPPSCARTRVETRGLVGASSAEARAGPPKATLLRPDCSVSRASCAAPSTMASASLEQFQKNKDGVTQILSEHLFGL